MVKFFNIKEWPIVYLKSNNNDINDELFETYKKEYLTLLLKCKKNREKIILIYDLTIINNFNNLPLTYIMKHANFNKEIYNFNKEYIRSICILCNNNGFKNILNLFFSICKPACQYKLCKNYEKAQKYLLENFNINFDISLFKNETNLDDEELSFENFNILDSNINDSDNNSIIEMNQK
jgi:hypothetical protein